MELTPEELRRCSIAGTLALIGEKWSILILRDVLQGVSRFDDFLARLQCSPAVLSARLKTLTEAGLLRRVRYREPGERQRFAYRPTRAAVELMPVIVGLMQWGDRHLAGQCGGPAEVRSTRSGLKVHAALVDEAGDVVPLNELKLVRAAHAGAPVPGASPSSTTEPASDPAH
ncbi:HxlR family transcriptional regulator [Cupriavidus gilardii J11]|uniref:HxlR family transcriptional regulator n=1 Tax=Cupriavidus gilardii J11 TaxID=936133 RepID=A0A562BT33_9BURK|nr:helix-turn-helix domain-containing protein [Cupriavidus gilardii]TWG88427.1 HxlR family transcriptional regulator [Cupriavidus gilardii J11]